MKLEQDAMYRSPIKTSPLIWKGRTIPDYTIRNDGILFHNGKECSRWQVNGRNYALVLIDGHHWQYRVDYMVAYTFHGMYEDSIRLIHINGDIADDCVDNLVWYRKVDVLKEYRDLVIIEKDGSIREEWKPCLTEYNRSLGYEVSNMGMVRDNNHNLLPIYENHGYRVFYYLDEKTHNTRIKSIHRAVAEAFIPNPNGYVLVNHLDRNKQNDFVFNLEWASNSMNSEHAYLQNLNVRSEYNASQIHAVCELLVAKVPHVDIANMTGVDRKTVSDIYRGRRWEHISSQYNFPGKKWTPELKQKISDMIVNGMKGKEIFAELNIDYDQPAISLYERLRRELKAEGKIN